MKENSPVSQLGNFVDRPWGVSEIGGTSIRDSPVWAPKACNARARAVIRRHLAPTTGQDPTTSNPSQAVCSYVVAKRCHAQTSIARRFICGRLRAAEEPQQTDAEDCDSMFRRRAAEGGAPVFTSCHIHLGSHLRPDSQTRDRCQWMDKGSPRIIKRHGNQHRRGTPVGRR
jgi:hypothetical protein